MLLLASLSLALAAPSAADGCRVDTGAPGADGVAPVHAVCHWTDVSADDVVDQLRQFDRYGRFVTAMTSETIVDQRGDAALVHIVADPGWPGVALRESRVWMRAEPTGGAVRVVWSSAAEAFAVGRGHVVTPRNEGAWEVRPSADGGVDVVEDVTYDPGGYVPAIVVRYFQTSGVSDELEKLHDLARRR